MIIQTHNLMKKYKAVEAVSHLDLAVSQGSIYGFLGPNGAGKTTTIRLLLGLLTPSAGEVLLFGQPLQRHKKEVLRNIGSLVETPSLYGLDVLRILARQPSTQPYLGWPLAVLVTISSIGTLVVVLPGLLEFNRRDIY